MMFRRKNLTLFERTSFCPSRQNKRKKIDDNHLKPKSVIRPYEDFLDYLLRSFGFYKMPFACF